jgi:hypothetical protein
MLQIFANAAVNLIARKATSWSAARQYRGSATHNAFDDSTIYYMDVGVWAGGQDGKAATNFGLVSGRDIVLCDWMNLRGGLKWPGPD